MAVHLRSAKASRAGPGFWPVWRNRTPTGVGRALSVAEIEI
jgi:hypothetical protein